MSTYQYWAAVTGEASVANYWRMDEAGTTTTDEITGTNTITFGGTYTRSVPTLLDHDMYAPDYATSLDGITGYGAAAAATLSGATAFSAEVWWKRAGAPNGSGAKTHHTLAQSVMGDGYQPRILVVESTGLVLFQFNDAGGTLRSHTSTASVASGRHHIVATHNGTVSALYVDGVATGTPQTYSLRASSTYVLTIGRYQAGVYQANGVLDEIALFSAALTPTQVAAHYAAGLAKPALLVTLDAGSPVDVTAYLKEGSLTITTNVEEADTANFTLVGYSLTTLTYGATKVTAAVVMDGVTLYAGDVLQSTDTLVRSTLFSSYGCSWAHAAVSDSAAPFGLAVAPDNVATFAMGPLSVGQEVTDAWLSAYLFTGNVTCWRYGITAGKTFYIDDGAAFGAVLTGTQLQAQQVTTTFLPDRSALFRVTFNVFGDPFTYSLHRMITWAPPP